MERKHLDDEAKNVRAGIVLTVIGFITTCILWHPFFFVGITGLGLWLLHEPPRNKGY